eukprot:TRINITY_DN20004_c0_g3_i2.p1 TRINITY_DN20004_c0_g3~~TRINITY_DN20004_c0_g3_i2.p1  ORF type:complete len:113 (-),score=4.51 TRINITY_DN20004_c0_g3_i2:378-716(-)
MDLQEMGDRNGLWTNEKHISFLNWMEASFVRRMLENDDRSSLTYAHGDHPPLDRVLPDCADSTVDFTNERNRRKNHVNHGIVERNIRIGGNIEKGIGYSPPYDASQDQVCNW